MRLTSILGSVANALHGAAGDPAQASGAAAAQPTQRDTSERPAAQRERGAMLRLLRRMMRKQEPVKQQGALAEYREQLQELSRRLDTLPNEVLGLILKDLVSDAATARHAYARFPEALSEVAGGPLAARAGADALLALAGNSGKPEKVAARFDGFFAVVDQAVKDRRHSGNFEAVVVAAAESLFYSLARQATFDQSEQEVLFGPEAGAGTAAGAESGRLPASVDRLTALCGGMQPDQQRKVCAAMLGMLSLPPGKGLPEASGKLASMIGAIGNDMDRDTLTTGFMNRATACRDPRVVHDALRFLESRLESIRYANLPNLMLTAVEGLRKLQENGAAAGNRDLADLVPFARTLQHRLGAEAGISDDVRDRATGLIDDFVASAQGRAQAG